MDKETQKQVSSVLGLNNEGYVLICCDKPCAKGKMQVNMMYKGDDILVSYLLENAQDIIDREILSEKEQTC